MAQEQGSVECRRRKILIIRRIHHRTATDDDHGDFQKGIFLLLVLVGIFGISCQVAN